MLIPNKVKIAGITYNIERPATSFVDGVTACDGLHVYSEHKIKVASIGDVDYQNVIFLHELIHAIIEAYCPDRQDEHLAEQLSKGLYQVFKDNPDIIS